MDIIYTMWLHLKRGIPIHISNELIKYFGSAKKVYLAEKSSYITAGIHNDVILNSLMDKSIKSAEKEIIESKLKNITIIGLGEETYPSILYEIPDPPLILYVKGEAGILLKRNMFCIVGTRHSTAYGMSAALGISEQLARCGMIIVSGVALGIDTAAHRGAIRGEGKTVGIMGCGIDIPYPAGNEETRSSIIQNGALISEFPLGTPPVGSNFPIRNRLLSAFSLGVAVMEAGERSGALITAKYAAEQGRDVFALPGNISSPMSGGTNRLIQDGAILLTGADAILQEYLLRYPSYFPIQDIMEERKASKEKQQESVSVSRKLQHPEMSEHEKRIRKILTKDPIHADEIARLSGLKIQEVLSAITIMQINGRIKEFPGNRFSL